MPTFEILQGCPFSARKRLKSRAMAGGFPLVHHRAAEAVAVL